MRRSVRPKPSRWRRPSAGPSNERGQLRIGEVARHQVVKVQLLGMHEGGKLADAAVSVPDETPGPAPRPRRRASAPRSGPIPPHRALFLAAAWRSSSWRTTSASSRSGSFAHSPRREDFRHPLPIAKLDVGDVHGRQFLRGRRRFQHQAIEEAFLEFVHASGHRCVRRFRSFTSFSMWKRRAMKRIQVSGNVDEERRIFLCPASTLTRRQGSARSARRGPGRRREARREKPGRGPSAGARD